MQPTASTSDAETGMPREHRGNGKRPMHLKAFQDSPTAVLLIRVILVVLSFVFFIAAVRGVLVITRYDTPRGTGLWNAAAGTSLVSTLSGMSALALACHWRWAAWVWAISVSAVSIAGLAVGLNPSFLFRWEVALPWTILAGCGALGLEQARPWKDAGQHVTGTDS
jgi:hypothetical protein